MPHRIALPHERESGRRDEQQRRLRQDTPCAIERIREQIHRHAGEAHRDLRREDIEHGKRPGAAGRVVVVGAEGGDDRGRGAEHRAAPAAIGSQRGEPRQHRRHDQQARMQPDASVTCPVAHARQPPGRRLMEAHDVHDEQDDQRSRNFRIDLNPNAESGSVNPPIAAHVHAIGAPVSARFNSR